MLMAVMALSTSAFVAVRSPRAKSVASSSRVTGHVGAGRASVSERAADLNGPPSVDASPAAVGGRHAAPAGALR